MTNGDDPNNSGPGQPAQGNAAPPPQQPAAAPPAQQPQYPPYQQPGYPPANQPGYPSAGGAPGYPPPQTLQPGVPGQDGPKPGFLMPGIWLGVAVLVTLVMGGYVGFAAWRSETAGMQATYAAAWPLGTVWAGAITALAVHLFYKKGNKGVRVGVPIGCGCLGGMILFGLIFVFFATIFRAL